MTSEINELVTDVIVNVFDKARDDFNSNSFKLNIKNKIIKNAKKVKDKTPRKLEQYELKSPEYNERFIYWKEDDVVSDSNKYNKRLEEHRKSINDVKIDFVEIQPENQRNNDYDNYEMS